MRNHSYENGFDLHDNETACRTHFHMKGFALRLVLKLRHNSEMAYLMLGISHPGEGGGGGRVVETFSVDSCHRSLTFLIKKNIGFISGTELDNTPFPSCFLPLCQNESPCQPFMRECVSPTGSLSFKLKSFSYEKLCTSRFETEAQIRKLHIRREG